MNDERVHYIPILIQSSEDIFSGLQALEDFLGMALDLDQRPNNADHNMDENDEKNELPATTTG